MQQLNKDFDIVYLKYKGSKMTLKNKVISEYIKNLEEKQIVFQTDDDRKMEDIQDKMISFFAKLEKALNRDRPFFVRESTTTHCLEIRAVHMYEKSNKSNHNEKEFLKNFICEFKICLRYFYDPGRVNSNITLQTIKAVAEILMGFLNHPDGHLPDRKIKVKKFYFDHTDGAQFFNIKLQVKKIGKTKKGGAS